MSGSLVTQARLSDLIPVVLDGHSSCSRFWLGLVTSSSTGLIWVWSCSLPLLSQLLPPGLYFCHYSFQESTGTPSFLRCPQDLSTEDSLF